MRPHSSLPRATSRLLRRLPLFWSAAALAAGLCVTAALSLFVAQSHAPQQTELENRHALHREALLCEREAALELLLLSARAHLASQPNVNQESWSRFFATLSPTHDPLSPKGRILALQERGRQIRTTLITHPQSSGEWMERDFRALPAFAQALEATRRSGQPTLSAPTLLEKATTSRPVMGFFSSAGPGTWVGIILPVEEMVRPLEELAADEAIWRLEDTTQNQRWPLGGTALVSPYTQRVFRVGGRTWTLSLRMQNPAHEAPYPLITPTVVLVLGICASLLMGLTTWSLLFSQHRAKRLARRMNRATHHALTRFQHLIQETPLAVIEWDGNRQVVAWNPAATRVFGFDPGEIIGRDGVAMLFPGGSGEAFDQAFSSALGGHVPPTALACATRKDGAPVLGEWSHVPMQGAQGVTSLVLDVTHKHEADEHLKQYQRLESLGVLAGGIAHDFNNLLGIMTGFLEQAASQVVSDPHQALAMIDKVDQALGRAAGLARQMLAYAGKAPARVEPVDLNHTITSTLDLLRASLPKLIVLDAETEESLPRVRMDPTQLQQVIMNLVTNAWEAIGDRSGHIWVRTRMGEVTPTEVMRLPPGLPMASGPVVVMEVEDDGCGMDRETLRHIFDPFYSTKFQGRGLGLSVILGILRAHGASLRVKSLKGTGSTFRVLLPIHPSVEHANREPENRPFQVPATTILFADDEPMLRDLAQKALEADGHVPLLAEDGQAALRLYELHRSSIALAVLDVTMPKLGGLEVMERLHHLDPHLPIILSSGYSDQAIPQVPGVIFLPKPYRIQHLRQAVARQLAERASVPNPTGGSRTAPEM